MRGLGASLLGALVLLLAAMLTDDRLVLLIALIACSVIYFLELQRAVAAWPTLDLPRIAGISLGLFYFLGAVPVNLCLFGDPDYVAGYAWKVYRDYTPQALATAGVLVLMCSTALMFVGARISPVILRTLWRPETFYGDSAPRPDVRALTLFLTALSAAALYLLATGQLAVDFNPVTTSGSRHATTLYFIVFLGCQAAAPALPFLILQALRRGRLPIYTLACAAIVLVALFFMGRRPLIAALIVAALFSFYYAGWRLSRRRWVTLTVLGWLTFVAASVPFNQFRAAGGQRDVATAASLFSPDANARRSALSNPTMQNLSNVTIMRFDLLGELAEVTPRLSADTFWLGRGMASQTAVLAPGFLWDGKALFLATQVISDERILEAAQLRPTDIAGTPVLYGYAEAGWLAPVVLLAQIWIYLGITGLIVAFFRSYAVWLLAVGSVLANMLQADAFTFGAMLFYTAYLVVFAVALTLLRGLPGRQVAPAVAQVRRPRNDIPGVTIARPWGRY